MDKMKILFDAATAKNFLAQPHYATSVNYHEIDATGRSSLKIEVEWVERLTGIASKVTYDDDVSNVISRLVGNVQQKQIMWFSEPIAARLWLTKE